MWSLYKRSTRAQQDIFFGLVIYHTRTGLIFVKVSIGYLSIRSRSFNTVAFAQRFCDKFCRNVLMLLYSKHVVLSYDIEPVN